MRTFIVAITIAAVAVAAASGWLLQVSPPSSNSMTQWAPSNTNCYDPNGCDWAGVWCSDDSFTWWPARYGSFEYEDKKIKDAIICTSEDKPSRLKAWWDIVQNKARHL